MRCLMPQLCGTSQNRCIGVGKGTSRQAMIAAAKALPETRLPPLDLRKIKASPTPVRAQRRKCRNWRPNDDARASRPPKFQECGREARMEPWLHRDPTSRSASFVGSAGARASGLFRRQRVPCHLQLLVVADDQREKTRDDREGRERDERGSIRAGDLLDMADDGRADETAEISDRIDQGDAARCRRARRETRSARPRKCKPTYRCRSRRARRRATPS